MDILFDKLVAVQLMSKINGCCNSMVKDTRELMTLLKQADTWNDYQKQAFESNVIEIAKDLNQALKQEDEYIKTYNQRVQELGG